MGGPPLEMEDQVENPLERDHFLSVLLPEGTETNATVHGSTPVMDLLVTLCATYRLNPSDYTIELLSPNKNNISFKPNSPIGALDADRIVLKPRQVEEKTRRPYMPEATVRLLINYNRSYKAVVRVNPRVPLDELLPAVCNKCEFQVESTVLLRDDRSDEPLDLTKTLNDLGLREVFARDTACREPPENGPRAKTPEAAEVIAPPALTQDLPKKEKEKKQKENAGFLSLFRRKKKKQRTGEAVSAPTSPGLSKQGAVSMKEQDVCCANTLLADMPKKRRAPQPPMSVSQSVPNSLSTCHLREPQRSAENTLRSTKRRAPPPPCGSTRLELQTDTRVTGTVDFVNAVEEQRESDVSVSVHLSPPASPSPHPSQTRSSSSSSRPSFEPYLPSFRGMDLSDARCALAKVLTSSVSKGTLVTRLKNSATFPKLYSGSFLSSAHWRPDNNDAPSFCAELESVIKSDLPTDLQWDDPLQRRGTTTFKVVPLKKETSHDPESSDQCEETVDVQDQNEVQEQYQVTLDVPDQCEVTGDAPEQYQVTVDVQDRTVVQEQYQVTPDVPNQVEVTDDAPEQYQVTLDVPDQCEIPGDVPDQNQVKAEDKPESEASLETEEDTPPLDRPDTLTPPPSPKEPDSPPPPPPHEERTCSALSEDEDDEEEEEEEDEPDVTNEVALAAPSDSSDGQRESLRSPSEPPASTDAEEREVVQEEEEEEDDESFPPPPPPVFFTEDIDCSSISNSGQDESTSAVALVLPPPPPLPLPPPPPPLPPAAVPAAAPTLRDRMSAGPSRFAQAVAMAVQRSRLQGRGKTFSPQAPSAPQDTLPSPPMSTYQYGA